MQYEVDIKTYKRVEKKKEINLQAMLGSVITIVFMGLMLGRVNFSFVEGFSIAPFGIAYLMAIISKKDIKKNTGALIGVSLGYLSTFTIEKAFAVYIITVFVMFIYGVLASKNESKVRNNIMFLIAVAVFMVAGIVLGKQSIGVELAFSIVKAISIIPTFYIINYGINCAEEINTNYLFSVEELISIAIVLCLIVAGIGNIAFAGVAVRNVIALAVIVCIAYAGGSAPGAIMGVAMGLIIGVANNDVLFATSLYAICGLIVGVFRETGKVISVISYGVSYLIVIMYSSTVGIGNVIELVVSSSVMVLLPVRFIRSILIEINNEEKAKIIDSVQIDGIKTEYIERIESLKSVLSTISVSLSNLSENDKLLLKGKGTALVENLADRVCANCELNRKCWERELHNTFSSFGELIKSCEEKKPLFPRELELKCVKKSTLLKNAEDLLNTYAVNEALKSRLIEGRRLIAGQVNNMSLAMGDIVRDFEKDVVSCLEIDKLLRKTFAKHKIRYKNIYTYTDKKGRLKIKIKVDNGDGSTYCVKNILPVISDLVRIPLSLSENESTINPHTNECTVVIEETAKYHMVSYAAFTPKDGERYSGDSFSFGKNKNGMYVTAVSDGMGSGPEAGLESGVAIELVEKFLESGFSEVTTLNTVNSIMSMKFNEEEKFTTLDLNAVDLYNGEASFIKVGGVVSFIRSGNEVEVVNSSGLPFGILDAIEIDLVKKKLKHGDIIVTISDGILDVDKNNIGDHTWLYEYIKNGSTNPEILSRDILEESKLLSRGRVFDDMTVVVSKVYSVY